MNKQTKMKTPQQIKNEVEKERFDPLDYWGKLAIEQTKEIWKLKEEIIKLKARLGDYDGKY